MNGLLSMNEIYYDPKHYASYGGEKRLSQATGKWAKEWLSSQRVYTLHKPVRKRYSTRPYKVAGIDYQWHSDLIDMIQYANVNYNYRYILVAIDVFSRYTWAIPIKDKTGKSVTAALRLIFAQGRKPQRFQVDEGVEYSNRHVQRLLNRENIRYFTVKSQFKASIAERVIRTIKTKLWHYFTHTGSYQWTRVLPQIIKSYNSAVHRTIGIAPENVNEENEHELWLKQERRGPQKVTSRDPKTAFQVDDQVRLSKVKSIFAKGYLPNWTEEIFTISRVLDTEPTQYKVKDWHGEEIKGSFYAAELQKVVPPERYAIEHVIRTRIRNGRREYFVKWMGYGPEFNSWTTDLDAI
jgi:hypothetical protein